MIIHRLNIFFGGGGRGGGSTWTIQTILTKPALTILTNSRRNACYTGKFGQFYRIYHLFTLSLLSPSWPLKVSVTYLNDVTSWFCHFFVSLLSYSRVILIAASRTIMLLIRSWFQSDLLWRYEILFSHLIDTFHFTHLWVKVNECFKILLKKAAFTTSCLGKYKKSKASDYGKDTQIP